MREASVEDAKLSIAGAIGFQIRRSRWRLKVTDEAGKVTKSARQCLELIAKHEMVLATAHISPAEMPPVVKAARECGVKRIVITHPEFPTTCLWID